VNIGAGLIEQVYFRTFVQFGQGKSSRMDPSLRRKKATPGEGNKNQKTKNQKPETRNKKGGNRVRFFLSI
jgi:hypothetical protein